MARDEVPPSEEHEHNAIAGKRTLSLDTVFEVLANKRRRFIVYTLRDAPGGILPFYDLVSSIMKYESVDPDIDDENDHRKTIATDLHHWHLPVLEEIGIITYDERSQVIQYKGYSLLDTWAELAANEDLP